MHSFIKTFVIVSTALAMASANPTSNLQETSSALADMEIEARPAFVCDDNGLAQKCRGAPYHYRCTNFNDFQYDTPNARCQDRTRCSCEWPCNNPKIC
ncbi:uncharacterized protein B0J16DRAFT_408140 [Fusarium flagelliforme]|uniref:uncharacterized protein n=1 Tax=Fusarium flagelliforme TaxID=2675880 RepID=UPI001E8D01FC|nr:uncharacterized protein B0J16DRAFT_408140 [Fusarium flagelliforme]KAH7196405.1 hypothetical protein B0J16DRAFT_408140 [Fusarium flagelliforme]